MASDQEREYFLDLLDPYRRGPKLRFAALAHVLTADNLETFSTINDAINAANNVVEFVAGDEPAEIDRPEEVETNEEDDGKDRGPYL